MQWPIHRSFLGVVTFHLPLLPSSLPSLISPSPFHLSSPCFLLLSLSDSLVVCLWLFQSLPLTILLLYNCIMTAVSGVLWATSIFTAVLMLRVVPQLISPDHSVNEKMTCLMVMPLWWKCLQEEEGRIARKIQKPEQGDGRQRLGPSLKPCLR